MYEKTGSQEVNYKFSTKSDLPDTEYMFLSMTTLWDLENPIAFDDFVWFVPTNKVNPRRITVSSLDEMIIYGGITDLI